MRGRIRGVLGCGMLLAGILAVCSLTAWAEDVSEDEALDALFDQEALPTAEPGLSRELLLFQEVPTVTLATKHEQPITLAPASISVITAEDIKRQGARTITDVLRNVPGINVNRISNSDVNIAARFPADNNNAEMLVLIDGRTVYQDFFGIVIWDALPVVMEDIERIEIIRGPASPLYGANAYAGIVNIITKDPDAHTDHTFSGSVGTEDRFVTTYIHSGKRDKWRYKAVASWEQLDEFHQPGPDDARENVKLYTTHYYDFAPDERVRFSAGMEDSDGDTFTGLGTFERDQRQWFVQSVVNYGAWQGQIFYNRFDGKVSNPLLDPFPNGLIVDPAVGGPVLDPFNPQGRAHIVNDVLNLEFQHTLEPLDDHKVTWGGGYRFNQIRSRNIFGEEEHLDIFNAFVQDEWAVADDLTLTGSVRFDHRQLTGGTVSPRLSAVYQWREDHVFRTSFSQAFRDPTQVESFIDITGGQVFSTLPLPVKIRANGNRDLDPMQITSFEAGYNGRYLDRTLRVKVDAFYNVLEDVIEFRQVNTGFFSFDNVGDADQWGAELELEYYWRPWLQPYANYSFLYFRAQADDVLGQHQKRGRKIESAPQHKFNVGVYSDWENGWSGMLQLHYVDEIREDFLNPMPATPASTNVVETLDDYARVDARVAYHIEDPDLELSLNVFNLFDDEHREHPLGQELQRQIVFNLLYRF